MPKRKKYNGNRKYKKRNDGTKALAMVRKMQYNQELKFADIDGSLSNIDYLGATFPIFNAIAQGDTNQTRNGDKITCKYVSMKIVVAGGVNSDDQTSGAYIRQRLRVILMWDKQNTIATVSELLLGNGSGNADLGHYNRDTRKQFIVLSDTHHILNQSSGNVKYISIFKELNKNTQFVTGGTTIESGALKLFAISNINSLNVNGDKPDISVLSRVRFTDN